jgi:hypothetical protein
MVATDRFSLISLTEYRNIGNAVGLIRFYYGGTVFSALDAIAHSRAMVQADS